MMKPRGQKGDRQIILSFIRSLHRHLGEDGMISFGPIVLSDGAADLQPFSRSLSLPD